MSENTRVKVEAHGHLGDFSKEYVIEPGKEWKTTARIMREFMSYVWEGWEKKNQELFKALEELEKMEKEATKE